MQMPRPKVKIRTIGVLGIEVQCLRCIGIGISRDLLLLVLYKSEVSLSYTYAL